MVISDFDGTITTVETFLGLLHHMYPQEQLQSMFQKVESGKETRVEACKKLIDSTPITELSKIDEYISLMEIRPGFEKLAQFLKAQNIPLIVLSGGLDYTVQGKLAPYRDLIHAFYSAKLDVSDNYLSVVSSNMEPNSFLDKSTVLDNLDAEVFIGIGDGITDLTIASKCHYMFARDDLHTYMVQNNLSCIPWETFYDVLDIIKNKILS